MPSDNHSLLKTIWCGGRLSYDVKFSHRALMNNGGLCRDEQWNSDFLLPMELMNIVPYLVDVSRHLVVKEPILRQSELISEQHYSGSLRNSGPSSRMAVWLACAKTLSVFLPTKSSALIDSSSQSVLKTTIKIETTHAI
ncbi:hypothetical protein SDJN02_23818, partial [Cucurbita argyrosperma subsp. argyrosperma]